VYTELESLRPRRAETAMRDRLEELQPSSDHEEERHIVADARTQLATLRRGC
jgi:hypothetical protein